ncbi:MAG: hypothetical protein OXL68_00415 [Paracoccaceae bacterium]|nr:hypothetical protein [Paracoccaceae bacterium]
MSQRATSPARREAMHRFALAGLPSGEIVAMDVVFRLSFHVARTMESGKAHPRIRKRFETCTGVAADALYEY